MIRELGPVLTGVMVSGRNASSMASELGSMVVTEQIDAMRALGVDPMRKLVTPRLFSSIAMLFFLTILANACGIAGGGAVTVFLNGQNGTQYFSSAWESLRYPDILQGLVKPLFSGFIIASIGCFYGMRTTGGTEGVGADHCCGYPGHAGDAFHLPVTENLLCPNRLHSPRLNRLRSRMPSRWLPLKAFPLPSMAPMFLKT
jgi:ABC transport permease subunit